MPRHVRTRVAEILNDERKSLRDSKILLLGVTYKANIADQRESPARPLATLLLQSGADLRFHDPKVETWHIDDSTQLDVQSDLRAALAEADLAVLLQNHAEYAELTDMLQGTPVLDTRGIFRNRPDVHTL